MTTTKEWLALAERCEKATGPDREIDAEIYDALCPQRLGYKAGKNIVRVFGGAAWLPCFTISLDAITTLIEQELPKAEFNSTSKVQGDGIGGLKRYAYAWLVIGPDVWGDTAVASEALARCAAFCRAKAAGA